MNYVDSLNLFGVEAKEIPCIKGSGAPPISTEGAVGLFYMNTNTGDVYKCDGVDDGVYTWNLLVDTVDIANKLGTDRFLRHPIDETDFSSNYGTPGSYAVSDGRGGITWVENSCSSDGVDLTGYATEEYVQDKIEEAQLSGGNVIQGGGAGWSTEEILLLEAILRNCLTSSNQTNNIDALVSLLQSNSSGSEGSGSGDDTGGNESTTYSVVLNLSNCTPSNVSTHVSAGGVYINQLSVSDGYILGTPVITMGGYDVTSQYYDGAGNIAIPSVSGNLAISCKGLATEALSLTCSEMNLMPDKSDYSYTETESSNIVIAKESTIQGGMLSVEWDDTIITGTPKVGIYLFKDSVAYIHTVPINNAPVDPPEIFQGTNITAAWTPAGNNAYQIAPTGKFTVAIPTGCTVMLGMSRNNMTNENVTSAGTWSTWACNGGITVRVTEVE